MGRVLDFLLSRLALLFRSFLQGKHHEQKNDNDLLIGRGLLHVRSHARMVGPWRERSD